VTITFDEEKHEYRLDGAVIPSVTQIIGGVGLVDTQWFTEESRQRGHAVHAATQLEDAGVLDWSNLHPEVEPRAHAWRKFKQDTGYVPILVEHMVHNVPMGYVGRLDRVCAHHLRANDRIILDIKSGLPGATTGLQLAGYVMALGESYRDLWTKRYGLWLREDATYRLIPYKELSDFEDFKAAIRLNNWRKRNNVNHGAEL